MSKTIGIHIYRNLSGDRGIWLIWFLLAVFSLMSVYSATGTLAYKMHGGNTEFYLFKQVMFLIVGGLITWSCAKVDYTQYSRWAPFLLMLAIPLLLYTVMFGAEINSARRWIQIPIVGVTFQTSDFAKLALIIYVARVISVKQEVIKDFGNAFIPIIVPILIICGLIAPADLSTALMLFATCVLMMFIGRVKLKYIVLLGLLGVAVISILMVLGTMFPDFIRSDTWVARISDFLNEDTSVYQVEQAKIAIAQGEWTGLGPGNSIQRNFLPSPYADFIYAIICEEYGLLGSFAVLFMYTWILYRCVKLVTRFPKAFGAMLAMGLALNIVIQAYLNIAVSVDLVPVTGLTLPMVSMGGTSLLFTCMSFGIILSVSTYLEKKDGLIGTEPELLENEDNN
jgi:cell division protein FtsW